MRHVAEYCDSVGLLSSREWSAVKREFCKRPAVGQTLDIPPSGHSGGKGKNDRQGREGQGEGRERKGMGEGGARERG